MQQVFLNRSLCAWSTEKCVFPSGSRKAILNIVLHLFAGGVFFWLFVVTLEWHLAASFWLGISLFFFSAAVSASMAGIMAMVLRIEIVLIPMQQFFETYTVSMTEKSQRFFLSLLLC